jgi:phosphoglucomutase
MMEQFRANPPKTLAGEKVVLIKDFKLLKQTDAQGKVTDLVMPEPSNVLQYFTAAGDKISVRPSGTEPKIKFYMEAKLPMADKKDFLKVQAEAMKKIDAFKKDLGI